MIVSKMIIRCEMQSTLIDKVAIKLLQKSLADIVAENRDKYFCEKQIKPLHIGFNNLDDLLGGLEGGDMIVIGARPAVGKSAFVTQDNKSCKTRKTNWFLQLGNAKQTSV